MELETKKRNWEEIILESDTKVAYELLQAYEEGNLIELGNALKINYENSIKSAELDLLTHLSDLMQNIILTKFSSEYHTQEHWEKICRLRAEIEEDLEWNDCLNKESIENEWNNAFNGAKYLASTFVDAKKLTNLSWKEVFEEIYSTNNYGK